jgi:sulfur carrier protein ThiS
MQAQSASQDSRQTMQVHVKLYSVFREHLPREAGGETTVELPDGCTVDDLVDWLGITRRIKVITVNGKREDDRLRLLHHGDFVRILPVVVGG